VNDIGPTVLLAQLVVDRSHIEEDENARAAGVGGLEQGFGGKIGDYQRHAALRQRKCRGGGIVGFVEPHILQCKPLVQEPAGRVVVVDRELCARNPVVLGRDLDEREAGLRFRAPQIADLDLDGIGQG
jgi:hypothetical protein